MINTIEQSVFFVAPAHELYEALMDSALHAAFTGEPAEISREVGGAFTAYSGYISGVNLALEPDRKIVQRWRAVDWPEGQFSEVTFQFTQEPDGTRLDFTHTGLPAGSVEEFRQGWIDNYWQPLQAFLQNKD